jgi:cytochrome c oxidase subunit III
MALDTLSPTSPTGPGGMLALPSGEERPGPLRQPVTLAALGASAAGSMLFGGLIAAYLVLRSTIGTWPPEGIVFDNYTAATLVVTLLMASVTVEWGAHALRRDQRGQALAGLGLTLALGLAFLNALWFLIAKFNFEIVDHPYGTVAYSMAFLAGLNGLIGFAFVLLTTLRVVGHQLTMANYQIMRATALYWHFVTVAWTAVAYTLYVSK